MPWSPEKIAAYEQLEAAIENCLKVFESWEPGTMMSGFVLVVNGVSFVAEGDEDYDPEDDDQEATTYYTNFYKRGQSPALSRGIIEATRDRFRRLAE